MNETLHNTKLRWICLSFGISSIVSSLSAFYSAEQSAVLWIRISSHLVTACGAAVVLFGSRHGLLIGAGGVLVHLVGYMAEAAPDVIDTIKTHRHLSSLAWMLGVHSGVTLFHLMMSNWALKTWFRLGKEDLK